MGERRKFARIALEKNIRLKFRGKKHFVERMLKDISLGGMFIKTYESMPLQTEFNFEFTIAQDIPPIRGRGIVVRITMDEKGIQNGIGIKFIELEGDGKKTIEDLIKKYAGNTLEQ